MYVHIVRIWLVFFKMTRRPWVLYSIHIQRFYHISKKNFVPDPAG
jgi:hypothetical protein